MHGAHDVATPAEYLAALEEPRRSEVAELDALIREVAPQLDGYVSAKILAYGRMRLKYASGRELDWFRIGVASNKGAISLYVGQRATAGFPERMPKANFGKGCVRIKRLADVDRGALADLIRASAALVSSE